MLFCEYELWPIEELDLFGLSDVPEYLLKQACDAGNKFLNFDIETLTAALYTDVQHDEYDRIYRQRRVALASLALAEFSEKNRRFLSDIINLIWSVCEESTWKLPDGQCRLPEADSYKFDSDSAKTAALLATTVQLFRKQLPFPVKKRVACEIKKRVICPFYDSVNLSSQDIAHSLLACMFTEENDEQRRKFVDRTLELLDAFFDKFSSGAFKAKTEQSLYSNSAYIFDILEILYNVTDQKFTVYSESEIKPIADGIYRAYIGNDGFSERITEEDGARIYLFGKRMDNKRLMDFGASEFLKLDNQTLPESINLFHKLYSLKYALEIINYGDNFDGQESGYIDSMDLYIKKTKGFSVAIKGGTQQAGNFMAYLENEPYIIDLEKSHNLPVINGCSQFADTRKAILQKLENGLSIDITKTFPNEAGILKWVRRVEAEEKYIVITDEYELSKNDDIRIIMLMKNKPILSGDHILAGDGSIVWDGNMALRAELVKSKTYNHAYRLVFHVKDKQLSGKIRIALKK